VKYEYSGCNNILTLEKNMIEKEVQPNGD
jgi:hypothetical protein